MEQQLQTATEKLVLNSLVKLKQEVQAKQDMILTTLNQSQEQVRVLQNEKVLCQVQLAYLSHEIEKLERLQNENL